MYKKIRLYINGVYVCSSNGYKTCKEFKQKALNDGFLIVASIPYDKKIIINQGDVVRCSYK